MSIFLMVNLIFVYNELTANNIYLKCQWNLKGRPRESHYLKKTYQLQNWHQSWMCLPSNTILHSLLWLESLIESLAILSISIKPTVGIIDMNGLKKKMSYLTKMNNYLWDGKGKKLLSQEKNISTGNINDMQTFICLNHCLY